MKAISIRQPWATMIAAGIKNVENRSWPSIYRGRCLSVLIGYYFEKGLDSQDFFCMV